MQLKIKEVYEGWKNRLMPAKELKDQIKQVTEKRLAICKNCPFNSSQGDINNFSYCKACGCPLKSKTACLSCMCGLQVHNAQHPEDLQELKWFPVLTSEENQIVNEEIDKP